MNYAVYDNVEHVSDFCIRLWYRSRVTDSPKTTFRDFAGALMEADQAKASRALQTLLSLDEEAAGRATAHFAAQMSNDPSFMMKAMGMRTAVESKNPGEVQSLLEECFALASDQASASAKSLLAQYD